MGRTAKEMLKEAEKRRNNKINNAGSKSPPATNTKVTTAPAQVVVTPPGVTPLPVNAPNAQYWVTKNMPVPPPVTEPKPEPKPEPEITEDINFAPKYEGLSHDELVSKYNELYEEYAVTGNVGLISELNFLSKRAEETQSLEVLEWKRDKATDNAENAYDKYEDYMFTHNSLYGPDDDSASSRKGEAQYNAYKNFSEEASRYDDLYNEAKTEKIIEEYEDPATENAEVNVKTKVVNNDKNYRYINVATIADYINGHVSAEEIIEAVASPIGPVDLTTSSTSVANMKAAQEKLWLVDQMTDKEKQTFLYWAHNDKTKAENYFDEITPRLTERIAIIEITKANEMASENPVSASIYSVVNNVVSAPRAAFELISQSVGDDDFDPYALGFRGSYTNEAIRGTVAENIDNPVGKFFYNVGMSMADSVVVMPLGSVGTVFLGMNAAVSEGRKVAKEGGSKSQILTKGIAAGVFEAAFEKISIEKLLSPKAVGSFADALKTVLKQGGIEASEELCTSLANNFIDELKMGSESQFNKLTQKYMDDGSSYSEAQSKAALEIAGDTAIETLSGFVSGVLFGVGGAAVNYASAHSEGKSIKQQGNVETLVNKGMQQDENSSAYKRASKIENSENPSNAEVGALLQQMIIDKQISESDANKLVSEGFNGLPLDEAEQAFFYAGANGMSAMEAAKTLSDLNVDSERAIKAWQMGAEKRMERNGKADTSAPTVTTRYARDISKAINETAGATVNPITRKVKPFEVKTEETPVKTEKDKKRFYPEYTSYGSLDEPTISLGDAKYSKFRTNKPLTELGEDLVGIYAITGEIPETVLNKYAESVWNGTTLEKAEFTEKDSKAYDFIREQESDNSLFLEYEDSWWGKLNELNPERFSNDIKKSERQKVVEDFVHLYERAEEEQKVSDFYKNISDLKEEIIRLTKEDYDGIKAYVGNDEYFYKPRTEEGKSDLAKLEDFAHKDRKKSTPVKAVKFKGKAYNEAVSKYKTAENAKDFDYAYTQGFNHVKPSEDINLEDVAISSAYLAGVSDSRAVVSSRANFEARTPGLNLIDTVSRDIATNLDDSTRATINNIGKKLGVEIVLTNKNNEIAGGNTKHSRNSSYNFKNGVVTINVDERHIGLKGRKLKKNELVRFILAHEGTHRLQETSPEAYAEMEKIALSKNNMTLEEYMKKWNISDEAEARGEIVADYFGDLLSTKAEVKALLNENRSLWDKILEVIDWLIYKLKGAGVAYNDISEARELFRQALNEADATVWGAEVRSNESGSFGENEVVLSRSTYDEEGRTKLINWLNNSKLEKSERDRIVSQLDFIYDITTKYTDKFTVFGKWSQAEVLKGEDGKPVLSVVKQNGEYKLNLDFSSVCSKRRPLDTIITKMVESGIINDVLIDENGLVKLNQIINKHGLTVACALCCVEGRRYRQEKVAKDFANLYNGLVDRYNENSTDFAKRILSEQPLNDKGGHKETVDYKIAKHLETHPDERKHIDYTDFMSSEGFTKVAKENPELLKLYNSKKGTGGPKAAFADVQYLNEILSKKTFNAKTAFAVGGVRIQSFSDFVPRLVFDYAQMVADLDAKKLPAHAYTKVVDFVKIFGLTGIKINMSLIPKYVKGGVAPGLDADGNYAWDAESFDFDLAIEIQSDEGYSKNCGTIAVGVSYGHIMKLLADDRIKMVIPYHKSGINPIVAKMLEISAYEDYTKSQTTKHNDGTALTKEEKKKEFNFNEVMHNRGLTAKEAADEYLKWCDKNDYRPKFAEFRDNENYYKLLADFSCYDVNGEYSPQTSVKMNYPDNVDALIGEAIGKDQSNEDAILREADGIIEEFSAWNETRDDGEVWSRSEEAEYLELAKNPEANEAKLRKLVEEAARKAGYNVRAYHGTSRGGFTSFDTYGYFAKYGLFGNGAYFTESLKIAKEYQNKGKGNNKQVYDVYLKFNNVIDMDKKADISEWKKSTNNQGFDIAFREGMSNEEAFRAFEEELEYEEIPRYEAEEIVRTVFEDMGYDGITHMGGGRIYDNERHRVWIAFEPTAIKSADLVTYDENGDIIPLEERFNEKKSDIRWSRSEPEKTFAKGEAPRRDIDVPSEVGGKKVMRGARTTAEAEGINEDYAFNLVEEIRNGNFTYEVSSNKAVALKATNEVNENYNEAKAKWDGIIMSGKRVTPEDIALGEALLVEASHRRSVEETLKINAEVAMLATEAGQVVQAMRILKRLSPSGQLRYLEVVTDRINAERQKTKGKKYDRLIESENEVANANKKYQEADKKVKNLEKKSEEILNTINQLQSELESEDRIANLEEQKKALIKEIAMLKKELAKESDASGKEKIREQIRILEEDIKENASQLKDALDEKSRLVSERNAMGKELTAIKNAKKATDNAVEKLAGDMALLENEIADLDSQLEKAAKFKKELEEELSKLRKERRTIKDKIKRREDSSEKAFAEIEPLENEIAELKEKLEVSNTALNEVTEKRNALREERNKLREKLERREGAIERETTRTKEITNQIAQLLDDLYNTDIALEEAKANRKAVNEKRQKVNELARYAQSKAGKVVLPDDLKATILQAQNEEELKAAMEIATDYIAANVRTTWAERIRAWRYLAMLGNLRTIFRNFLGNVFMNIPVAAKNVVAYPMELVGVPLNNAIVNANAKRMAKKGISQETIDSYLDRSIAYKTQTLKVFKKRSEDIKKFVKESWDTNLKVAMEGGKYDSTSMADEIESKRVIFDNKVVEAWRKATNWAMESGDLVFVQFNYKQALTRFMLANNLNPETITQAERAKAEAYAIKEAQEATFRDKSELAEILNRAKSTSWARELLLGGLFPFTKTPINVMKRSFEYSPLGLFKTASDVVEAVKGTKSTTDVINSLAKTISGSGLVVLGFYMAAQGILRSTGDDEDEEYDYLAGEQDYAIVIGKHRYTIDWASPSAIPLLLGAAFYENVYDKDGGVKTKYFIDENGKLQEATAYMNFVDGLNSLLGVFTPVFEATYLSGFSDAIEVGSQFSSKPGESLLAFGTSSLTSFGGQFVPTALGQIARIIDPIERRNNEYDKSSAIPRYAQKGVSKILNKIPGVRQMSTPYVDPWGEIPDVKTEPMDYFWSAVENLISPGFYSKVSDDELTKELWRLQKTEAAEGKNIFPEAVPNSVTKTINGEKSTIYLNPEQKNEYQETKSKTANNLIDAFYNSEVYNNLTDEQRSEVVDALWDYADEKGLQTVVEDYTSSSSKVQNMNLVEANVGLRPEDYILYKLALDVVDKPNDNGNLGTFTQKEASAALEEFRKMTSSDPDDIALAYLWQMQTDGKSSNNPYGYAIRGTNWYRPNGKDQYDKLWMKER